MTSNLTNFESESESEVAQSCPTLRPRGLWPTRLFCPWGSPGKNTGVGCHFLLQRIFLILGISVGIYEKKFDLVKIMEHFYSYELLLQKKD